MGVEGTSEYSGGYALRPRPCRHTPAHSHRAMGPAWGMPPPPTAARVQAARGGGIRRGQEQAKGGQREAPPWPCAPGPPIDPGSPGQTLARSAWRAPPGHAGPAPLQPVRACLQPCAPARRGAARRGAARRGAPGVCRPSPGRQRGGQGQRRRAPRRRPIPRPRRRPRHTLLHPSFRPNTRNRSRAASLLLGPTEGSRSHPPMGRPPQPA
jgi:hypothetical protein